MKKHHLVYLFLLFFQALQAQAPAYDPDFGNNGFLEFDNGDRFILSCMFYSC